MGTGMAGTEHSLGGLSVLGVLCPALLDPLHYRCCPPSVCPVFFTPPPFPHPTTLPFRPPTSSPQTCSPPTPGCRWAGRHAFSGLMRVSLC